MRSKHFAATVAFLCSGAAVRLDAAREVPADPPTTTGPFQGTLTLELGFTADFLQGRTNLLAPLFRSPDGKTVLFLDGNWTGRSDRNENGSGGFSFRHHFDEPDVIIGFNGFFDYGDFSGNGYKQFGVGFEMLSKWFDFRANAYFPFDSIQPISRYSTTRSSSKNSSSENTSTSSLTDVVDGGEGFFFITTTRNTTRTETNTHEERRRVRRTYERREGPMPGFDLEAGGLIPYLDRWAETRIFFGYAFFDDPFGNDISCFTARLESRPVPALVFNVEYKGDTRLVDGENHWYFCTRVEIPFDLGNLIHGQSPFAGITDAFTRPGSPASDVMRNRMNENIIRNWRPIISRSGYRQTSQRTTAETKDTTTVTETSTTSVTESFGQFP